MNEDYLWDRSGEQDKEIMHLEGVLGQLRWQGSWQPTTASNIPPWAQRKLLWTAAAAILLIGIAGTVFLHEVRTKNSVTSWRLSLAGGKEKVVRAGQVIETAKATHGVMESEFIGEVHIDPNSRLRVLSARDDEHRLALDHGTIRALIWAPPTSFIVDTPSAHAVDLGCQYTLRVAKNGAGLLTVETGWVAFQWHDVESFIPAGAACITRQGSGPGTPYFLNAPATMTAALDQFDATGSDDALKTVLSGARPRDGLTLWHLLGRTHGEQRVEVLNRFVTLVNLPSDVSRRNILAGDRKSMDAAWDALQLGDTSWWREWKRRW
ncbi:MAG TPA: hypothetical protein VN737_17780 [Bryobacteraceae bacterium]|nr:hypothetical protein [Bryobacteraceae bacterium]